MTKHCTLHYCYCGRGLSVGPSVAPPGPTLGREVVLECTHGLVSSCSYSYVTKFTPSQEERCSGPPRRHTIHYPHITTLYLQRSSPSAARRCSRRRRARWWWSTATSPSPGSAWTASSPRTGTRWPGAPSAK